MDFDLIVVGAGPNGLCFARALEGSGLHIALVDQQPRSALADPDFDGREIALTQHSVELLRRMGVWERIPASERHLLRAARVLNGKDPQGIEIQPEGSKHDSLGWLAPNHLIRRAAFEALDTQPGLHWFDGLRPIAVDANADCAEVQLANGQLLRGRLLVAADSRFSETRRALGVPPTWRTSARACWSAGCSTRSVTPAPPGSGSASARPWPCCRWASAPPRPC
jgi:2-polyprenyl-6-methoxyphenol hydroxylase-like FAD-dependent oxidoreductase